MATSNFKCLRPRIIENSAGQKVSVSCGHCAACLSKKSSKYANLCNFESKDHKYTYFVTLTYSQANLPFGYIDEIDGHPVLCYANDRFCDVPNPFVGDFYPNFSDKDICDVNERQFCSDAKSHSDFGDGYISFLSKVDAQRFLKRFRYFYYIYTKKRNIDYEKVRYYLVGEYGPKHLRPHFHLLFFFNSDTLAQKCSRFVHQAWKFGRVDCQRAISSGEGVAHYTASYCNGASFLPKIFNSRALRPFCLHSQRFGESPFLRSYEEVLRGKHRGHVGVPLVCGTRVSEVYAPVSLSTRFVPRCYRYSQSDDYQRYVLLSLYERASKYFNLERPSVPCLCSLILGFDTTIKDSLEKICGTSFVEGNLTTALNISRRYYYLKEEYPSYPLRQRIDDYYSSVDYERLKQWYINMENWSRYFTLFDKRNRRFLLHFYDNLDFDDDDFRRIFPRRIESARTRDLLSRLGISYATFDPVRDLDYRDNPDFKEFVVLSNLIMSGRQKHKSRNETVNDFTYY